jgi:hypothetical protein
MTNDNLPSYVSIKVTNTGEGWIDTKIPFNNNTNKDYEE